MLYPKMNTLRHHLSLDGMWDFALDREGVSFAGGFEPDCRVPVPSSYNDLFTDNRIRARTAGVWYQRRFQVPRSLRGQRLVLRFAAVSYRACVWLNGTRLGEHESGYTPFAFEIAGQVDWEGDNVLVVRVDHELDGNTLPQGNLREDNTEGQWSGMWPNINADFFPYSGLHRPVALYTTSPEAWLEDLAIETDIEGRSGRVSVRGAVGGAAGARVELSVEGGGPAQTAAIQEGSFSAQLVIPEVRLWDVGEPNLYHLLVRIRGADGRVLDEYRQRFGVRTVRVEGDRLLLNGKPVFLRGFGKHEDFHLSGKGLNLPVNVRDMELLKWIGANAFRTSHYPYAEEMLDLADEYGMLVVLESPAVGLNFAHADGRLLELHKRVLGEMIGRDRNHPCVIAWCAANEAKTTDAAAVPYFEEVVAHIRSLDATRPVMNASCHHERDRVHHLFDLVGVNTYPGWYRFPGQSDVAAADVGPMLDRIHAKFGKPLLVCEFGADTIAGFHALPAEQWSEEYQAELCEALLDEMERRPFVTGTLLWNFADFKTAQSHMRALGNKKGAFTRDRQPKMLAHALRGRWKADA